jgi:hypothetical protein
MDRLFIRGLTVLEAQGNAKQYKTYPAVKVNRKDEAGS